MEEAKRWAEFHEVGVEATNSRLKEEGDISQIRRYGIK